MNHGYRDPLLERILREDAERVALKAQEELAKREREHRAWLRLCGVMCGSGIMRPVDG